MKEFKINKIDLQSVDRDSDTHKQAMQAEIDEFKHFNASKGK